MGAWPPLMVRFGSIGVPARSFSNELLLVMFVCYWARMFIWCYWNCCWSGPRFGEIIPGYFTADEGYMTCEVLTVLEPLKLFEFL